VFFGRPRVYIAQYEHNVTGVPTTALRGNDLVLTQFAKDTVAGGKELSLLIVLR